MLNVTSKYNLQDILKEFEGVLQISGTDYSLPVDQLIQNVKERAGRQYGLDFINSKADDPSLEASASRDSLSMFLDCVERVHGKFCGYTQLTRYTKELPIRLCDCNYVGFTRATLKLLMRALSREDRVKTVSEQVNAVKEKLEVISMSDEKRVLVLLIVCYELGLWEVVAAIAELLLISIIKY